MDIAVPDGSCFADDEDRPNSFSPAINATLVNVNLHKPLRDNAWAIRSWDTAVKPSPSDIENKQYTALAFISNCRDMPILDTPRSAP